MKIESRVELAGLCTLELGGQARSFVEVTSDEELEEALRWARRRGEEVSLLGGGSNVVIADGGVDGLVVRLGQRGVSFEEDGGEVLVTARAGESWDELVAATVGEGLAGLECLSGIPGTAGAAPIQNVGAYGQEVADTIARVRVLDRLTLKPRDLTAQQCELGYRSSVFRRRPNRSVVLAVTFALRRGGRPTLRYPELVRQLGARGAEPTLSELRQAVLELRRSKSMVIDPADPNRRSVGSFFVNPEVSTETAERIARRAVALGAAGDESKVPRNPVAMGTVKLSAAWLIEACGYRKGLRRGAVGLSSRHALALVHHGGGSTAELLAFAREIRDRVQETFGVRLEAEPAFLGFGSQNPLDG